MFLYRVWPSHASRISFLIEFDRRKHVVVNYDWDLGLRVDLIRNVTMSRFRKYTNGLIYSGIQFMVDVDCIYHLKNGALPGYYRVGCPLGRAR